MTPLETARYEEMRKALEIAKHAFDIIAGDVQCRDNLMGNRDVAIQARAIVRAALQESHTP